MFYKRRRYGKWLGMTEMYISSREVILLITDDPTSAVIVPRCKLHISDFVLPTKNICPNPIHLQCYAMSKRTLKPDPSSRALYFLCGAIRTKQWKEVMFTRSLTSHCNKVRGFNLCNFSQVRQKERKFLLVVLVATQT